MRRAARQDGNHKAIVQAFRQVSMTVLDLSAVGCGCPDVCVGYRGLNVLVEIKDDAQAASRQQLRKNQQEWHDNWSGHVVVAVNWQDAIAKVVDYAKEMGRL